MLNKLSLGVALSLATVAVFSQDGPPPLPVEPTGVIETLYRSATHPNGF